MRRGFAVKTSHYSPHLRDILEMVMGLTSFVSFVEATSFSYVNSITGIIQSIQIILIIKILFT